MAEQNNKPVRPADPARPSKPAVQARPQKPVKAVRPIKPVKKEDPEDTEAAKTPDTAEVSKTAEKKKPGISKFTKGLKNVTVKKYSSKGKKIKSLKKGKKYYVRVRAYRVVNGKTYYGAWSKAKSKKAK